MHDLGHLHIGTITCILNELIIHYNIIPTIDYKIIYRLYS